jgi:hypothetical protein
MSALYAEPRTAELDPARQFDFWLGDWDCSWSDGDGNEGTATNTVYLDLDGQDVVESFDARPSSDYQGMSFSMYDPTLGRWRQTWVDSTGRYLDFVGGYENGLMDLRHHGEHDGTAAEFRALWHAIEQDRLEWAWQVSVDAGESWTTLWAMEYVRVL